MQIALLDNWCGKPCRQICITLRGAEIREEVNPVAGVFSMCGFLDGGKGFAKSRICLGRLRQVDTENIRAVCGINNIAIDIDQQDITERRTFQVFRRPSYNVCTSAGSVHGRYSCRCLLGVGFVGQGFSVVTASAGLVQDF